MTGRYVALLVGHLQRQLHIPHSCLLITVCHGECASECLSGQHHLLLELNLDVHTHGVAACLVESILVVLVCLEEPFCHARIAIGDSLVVQLVDVFHFPPDDVQVHAVFRVATVVCCAADALDECLHLLQSDGLWLGVLHILNQLFC